MIRIALAGGSGLVGQAILRAAVGQGAVRLALVARAQVPLPPGSRLEAHVLPPDRWPEVLPDLRPDVFVCALGTTWKRAGRSEEAFRAVDRDLVARTAAAARRAGARRMVLISAAGADPAARGFYLRVKGEAEEAVGQAGFTRLDILRPGLLRGPRAQDRRRGERIAIALAPLTDLALPAGKRKYRSIADREVARAALALACREEPGRFVHEGRALHRAAADWPARQAWDERG